jgi:putative tryptophan/tyrosine transport system substrate-binding protein
MPFDHLKRRQFIALLGGSAATWPLAVRGQQSERIRHIAVLMGAGDDPQGQSWIGGFQQRLAELGWLDGRDASVDVHWGGADIDHIRRTAAELVRSKPDVIVPHTIRVLNAVREATRDIPVVFVATSDPVGLGFVQSLAHPGGNLTGFMLYEVSVAGKCVQLLKEIAPHILRVALLASPDNLSATDYWKSIQEVSKTVGLDPTYFPVRSAAEIEAAISDFAREPNGGIVLPPDATTITHSDVIVALAARHQLPTISSFRTDVRRGMLMCYGPDTGDLFRRAASYIDRILKGAKPADLPVQAPTKFELAINMKTANALGLNVPTQMQLIADEVIE